MTQFQMFSSQYKGAGEESLSSQERGKTNTYEWNKKFTQYLTNSYRREG